MAVIVGYPGSVTWAGATNNAQLAGTGVEPTKWSLNMRGADLDTTAFAGTGAQTTYVKGLTDWDGTFEGTMKAPEDATLGSVTFSAGYVVNITEWTMDISRDDLEATVFAATERAYVPGLCRITGSFKGYIDDTTSVVTIGGSNASEPATGTFKYSERGATDATLAGSIFTTGLNMDIAPGTIGTVAYNYRMSGALTQSTPTAGVTILKTGTFDPTLDVASAITLAANGTKTYSGSAFWKSINISCAVGQLVIVRVGYRGTASLTIA